MTAEAHPDEPAPITRAYWRELPPEHADHPGVEWTDEPPTGPLDGWHGTDLPTAAWDAYTAARRATQRTATEHRRATEALQAATERLEGHRP